MRTKLAKTIVVGAIAGALLSGSAWAQPAINAAPCSMPGVLKASVATEVAETFVVPFAANSSALSPVAERVLDVAALSYPQQPILYLRIQGAEQPSETETLVKMDRLTWVTAYLAQRDVPIEAMVFEQPSLAQMGCASQPLTL